MVDYTVALKRSANLVVRVNDGVLSATSKNDVTLSNQPIVFTGRLDGLQDVVEGSPANGDILTYNSSNDKYYVLPLSLDNRALDGGTF